MIKEKLRPSLKVFATICATIFVIIETGMHPLKELEDPGSISSLFFLAAITVIFVASIVEVREEIRLRRIENIQYFYPLYRLFIVNAIDVLLFVFVPMAVLAFLVSVFG